MHVKGIISIMLIMQYALYIFHQHVTSWSMHFPVIYLVLQVASAMQPASGLWHMYEDTITHDAPRCRINGGRILCKTKTEKT